MLALPDRGVRRRTAVLALSVLCTQAMGGCSGFEALSDGAVVPDVADARDAPRVDAGPGDAPAEAAVDQGATACPGLPFSELAGGPLSSVFSADTAIAFDARDGSLHLLYQPQGVAEEHVLYSRRDTDGGWSTPERLSAVNTRADKPLIAVDGSGTVHVVYGDIGERTALHRQRPPGGAWSSEVTVPQGLRGQGDLIADAAGTLHLLLADRDEVRYHRYQGNWSSATTLETNAPFRSHRVGLADDGSRVYAVYCDADGRLLLRSSPLASVDFGSAAQPLATGLHADTCGAQIAVSPAGGVLHVVYGVAPSPSAGTLHYLSGSWGGAFSAPVSIGEAKSHALDYGGYQLLLADDQLQLVTASPAGKLRVFSLPVGGDWLTRVDGPWSAAFGVAATLGAQGELHTSDWDPMAHRPRHTTICPGP